MLSVLINTQLLMAARDNSVARFLFASSACVYPDYPQADTYACGLQENKVYPAMPEDDMAGKNCSASECVAISVKISGCRHSPLAVTTSMALWEAGTAVAKKRRPR